MKLESLVRMVVIFLSFIIEQHCNSGVACSNSCIGCNHKLDLVKAQYRLKLIKEKVQAVLGIDSDDPREGDATISNQMKDVAREIFQKTEEKFPEGNSEKQILLPHYGLPLGSRRWLVFSLSIRAVSGCVADLWLPHHFAEYFGYLCIKLKLRVNGKTVSSTSKVIVKHNTSLSYKSNRWFSLSISNDLRDLMRGRYNEKTSTEVGTIAIELINPKLPSSPLKKIFEPFVVVEVPSKRTQRKRRSVDCYPGLKSSCCREKLTVDFAEIGLQQHIIEPKRFEAYHCVGTCGSYSLSATTRVDIIKGVMNSMRKRNKKTDHIKFCCTAARSSSQKLIYYNNDKTKIRSRNVEGLVVEECDCL